MPDTPTPAPALTDEQIEELWRDLYITAAGCSERLIDPQDLDPLLAAVVARAKREAAEEIADELSRRAMRAEIDRLPGLAATYRGLIPTVRQIGATR